jgi:hypothetical protein
LPDRDGDEIGGSAQPKNAGSMPRTVIFPATASLLLRRGHRVVMYLQVTVNIVTMVMQELAR